MGNIYYKVLSGDNQITWKKIIPEDFQAAPKNHKHTNNAIGLIPQTNGGILPQNSTVNLRTFVGPLMYHKKYDIYQESNSMQKGVYFANGTNDTKVSIGIPGWEQGAIPYNNASQQLSYTYRQSLLDNSIFIPRCATIGMLTSNGQGFYTCLNFYYMIPEGTQSISISGKYIIRQSGIYLFTSGKNYTEGWAEQFDYRPSLIYDWQNIVPYNSDTQTGWWVNYDPAIDTYGRLRLMCYVDESHKQTTSYDYKSATATDPTTCVGTGKKATAVLFSDIKLTFHSTPSATSTPNY